MLCHHNKHYSSLKTRIRQLFRRFGVHPRRWWTGLWSYSRFVGYIKPQLLATSPEEFAIRRQLLRSAWHWRQLHVPVGHVLLVIAPHPDDESIGPGGLLLAHRECSELHLVVLCNGEGGGSLGEEMPLDPEARKKKMVDVRCAEFDSTVTTLKPKSVHHFDFPDGCIPCDERAESALRNIVSKIKPDVVLLPWFLDNQDDHRKANLLYARACPCYDGIVLGYEIWSNLEPNAVFDISPYLEAKLSLIQNYTSQLRTVDYLNYAAGLARVRAYHTPVNERRSGAVEGFVALPNNDYCEMVLRLYNSS